MVDFPVAGNVLLYAETTARHENGMRITAGTDRKRRFTQTYYSVAAALLSKELAPAPVARRRKIGAV